MLILPGVFPTLLSTFQAVYGLLGTSLTVRNGRGNINPINSNESQLSAPSSSSSQADCDTIDFVKTTSLQEDTINSSEVSEYSVNVANKSRVKRIIKDGLACWHFLTTLAHIIKRALAVKVHIVEPDKISLNGRRVANLFARTRDTMFKQS